MAEAQEQWKEIDGFPNYLVSDRGRVWSRKRNIYLRPNTNHDGYCYVGLSSKGVKRYKALHRLVAEVFLENPRNLPEVNHIDGDKTNNSVSNLEWTTRQANMRHAYDNRLIATKKAFDDARIEELKGLYATGEWTQKKLAEKYGVSQMTVCNYVRGVPSSRHFKKQGKLPPETKKEISRLYFVNGYTLKELGAMFGVSKTTVRKCLRDTKEAEE